MGPLQLQGECLVPLQLVEAWLGPLQLVEAWLGPLQLGDMSCWVSLQLGYSCLAPLVASVPISADQGRLRCPAS